MARFIAHAMRHATTALLAAVLLSCESHAALADTTQKLTVFAAASLKNALDDVAALYQKRIPEKVVLAYAASSALARQIENGAPADVFVSADLDWMDYLVKRHRIARGPVNVLRNELVLIAPAANRDNIRITRGFALAGLLGNGRLAIADPDYVPAGKYAKAALESLGVWNAVKDKLAQADNVRAALVLVARGEAPAGIVYDTDAKADRRVRVLDRFPINAYPPIIYPAAVLAGAHTAEAQTFLAFLTSMPAQEIFRKYGFTPY